MLILALLAVAAGPDDGKTMATDDWRSVAIYGVGGEAKGPIYLQVHAGDLDGDGLPDDAVLKLQCDSDQLRQAHYQIAARESGSGIATGKRMHKPVTVVKEWGPASPQLLALKPTYDVKTMKGNERVAAEDWAELSLTNTDGLCAAGQAAAAAIVKSKSNITNN